MWFVEYTVTFTDMGKMKLASVINKVVKAPVSPRCLDCWKHRQTQMVALPSLLSPGRRNIWPAVIFLLFVTSFLLKMTTNRMIMAWLPKNGKFVERSRKARIKTKKRSRGTLVAKAVICSTNAITCGNRAPCLERIQSPQMWKHFKMLEDWQNLW